jgi:hypothetical protein
MPRKDSVNKDHFPSDSLILGYVVETAVIKDVLSKENPSSSSFVRRPPGTGRPDRPVLLLRLLVHPRLGAEPRYRLLGLAVGVAEREHRVAEGHAGSV